MAAPSDDLPIRHRGVLLRRLSVDDLAAFQAVRGDPELARYQGWSAQDDHAARAFLAEMATLPLLPHGDWMQLAIADAGTGGLVGDIGLFIEADASEAEIGFTLARAAQGRGLATAAVEAALGLLWNHTPVARVRGITDARNAPSIRLLERAGFRRVGTREAVFKGERCSEIVYAMARPTRWSAPVGTGGKIVPAARTSDCATDDLRPAPPMSRDLQISVHSPATAEAVAAVDAGLDAFNAACPFLSDVRALHVIARNADRSTVGGAIGRTWGQCCELQQLWVSSALRRQGLGSRLLDAFEREAQLRGCRLVYLDTFSFQAPAFYQARGYVEVLRTVGFTGGVTKVTLQKRLPALSSTASPAQTA